MADLIVVWRRAGQVLNRFRLTGNHEEMIDALRASRSVSE